MKQITEDADKRGEGLSTEERNLLSVAYKNVIGARRASWRVLSSLEKNNPDPLKLKVIKEYREKVELELKDICKEILDLLEDHLIENAKGSEEKVFYFKMWVYILPLSHFKYPDALLLVYYGIYFGIRLSSLEQTVFVTHRKVSARIRVWPFRCCCLLCLYRPKNHTKFLWHVII